MCVCVCVCVCFDGFNEAKFLFFVLMCRIVEPESEGVMTF